MNWALARAFCWPASWALATVAVINSGSAKNLIAVRVKNTLREATVSTSEFRIEIYLQGIDAELSCTQCHRIRIAIDLIRTKPAQRHPDIVVKTVIELQDVTIGIGTTAVKIGVGECIEYRIAFQITINQRCLPVARFGNLRPADGDTRLMPFNTLINLLAHASSNFALIETKVLRIVCSNNHVNRREVCDVVLDIQIREIIVGRQSE